MIKTAAHFVQASSTRSRIQEKLRREWKRLTLTVVVYIVLVVVSAWIGSRGEYNLAGDSINGFALWFLLLPGYLAVGALGAICWCFGIVLPWCGNEAWLLGICDIVQILLIYVLVSLLAFARKKVSSLEMFRHFIRILVFWGLFQLACCAVRGVWSYGGISGLHRGEQTEAVTPDQR